MPKGIKGFQKGHKHSQDTKDKIGKANAKQVEFNCDMCGKLSSDKPSSYNRKKRHFCSMDCYSKFRKTKMKPQEQNMYKGVRKEGEPKWFYGKKWRAKEENKNKVAHLKARRYAREKGAEGSHTLEEWELIKDSCGNVCIFCGSDDKLTKDHIIPLSKGGSDYIENIQPLCRSCNSKKHNNLQENPELLGENK